VTLKQSGVQVSICGNDAREVLADWFIAKKSILKKLDLGAIKEVVPANKKLFAFSISLNGSSISN